ncbi:MAG: tape measure protein [Magnetococcales bacterium]|nr:tape measure protein [Magnetococcales bacterium]
MPAKNKLEIQLGLEAKAFQDGVKQAQDKWKSMAGGMVAAAKKVTADAGKLSTTQKTLAREMGKVPGKASAQTKSLKHLSSSYRTTQDAVASLTSRLLALAGAYVGFQTLTGLFKSFIQTAGSFEQIRIQLEGLMGSAEGGERAFSWVEKFTKNTPYEMAQVANSFASLKAFGLDPMDGTMQALTDQSAKLGGGQEKLHGIILAVGQAWAKGKLQGEEILQLVERGVPVWDLLAKATSKNVTELQDMSSKGQLGRDVIRALIDEMGRAADGQAQAQMKSWNGLVSNVKDTYAAFLDTVARSGSLDHLKKQLDGALSSFQSMKKEEMQAWAKKISDAIIGVAEAVKEAVLFIRDWGKEILIVVGALKGLSVLSNVIENFSTLKTAAVGLAGGIAGVTSASGALIATPIGATLAAAGTAYAGLSWWVDQHRKKLLKEAEATVALVKTKTSLVNALKEIEAKQKKLTNITDTITSKQEALARAETQRGQHRKALQQEEIRLTRKVLTERISAANKAAAATERAAEKSLAAERRLASEIKSLEEQKKSARMTTEEKLQALRERGMTDAQKESAHFKIATDKLREARKIIDDRDATPEEMVWAKTLLQQAQDAYAGLKKTNLAMHGVKVVGKNLDDLFDKQRVAASQALKAQQGETDGLAKSLVEAANEVEALQAQLNAIPDITNKTLKIVADAEQARDVIHNLEMEIDILSRKKIKIEAEAGITQKYASGGLAVRSVGSGLFSGAGTGTSDSNVVRISNQEYIVNAARTKRLLPILNLLNFGSDSAVSRFLSGIKGYRHGGLPQGLGLPSTPQIALAGGGQASSPPVLGVYQLDVTDQGQPLGSFTAGSRDEVTALADAVVKRMRGR